MICLFLLSHFTSYPVLTKIDHNIQKTVFKTIIFIALAIVILVLIHSFPQDQAKDSNQLNQYFQTKVKYVEELVSQKNFLDDELAQTILENEFYDDWSIRLFSDNELQWWKDGTLYDNTIGTDQIHYTHSSQVEGKELTLSFPLTHLSKPFIKRKYIVDAQCDYNYRVRANENYQIQNGQNKLGILPTSKSINIQILRLTSILLIMLFFLIYVYLYQLFDFESIKSLTVFYVLAIGFRFVGLVVSLFSSLSPLNISNEVFLINFFNPTIADFFVNGILIIFLASALGKYFEKRTGANQYYEAPPFIFPLLMSSFLGVSIIGFISFIKSWTSSSYLLFEIEKVFNTSATGVINIVSILLLSIGLFIAHHTVYKSIFIHHKSFSRRMAIVGSSIAISCLVCFFFTPEINLLYLSLGLASYLILLDLFLDAKSINITWLLWWIIVISGFLSIFIFKYVNDHKQTLNKTFLTSHIAKVDQTTLNRFDQITASIDEEQLNSIASIAHPLKIDRQDLINFFSDEIQDLTTISNRVEINCLDNKGASIINELPWNTENLIKRITTATKLNNNILFDPIENIYIKRQIIHNENHPGSPFELFISLVSSGENRLNSSYQFPFSKGLGRKEFTLGVYKNNKLLYSNSNFLIFPPEIPDLNYDGENYFTDIYSPYRRSFYKVNDQISLGSIEEISDLIKPISLFSYLFSLLGIVLALLAVINKYCNILPSSFSFDLKGTSLRDKIQYAVVSLIIVSFIAIAVVTAYYFSQISGGYSNTVLMDKINSIVNDTEDHDTDEGSIDIAKLGIVHRADILLYDIDANLISTTGSLKDKAIRVPYKIYTEATTDADATFIVPARIEEKSYIQTAIKKLSGDKMARGFVQVLFPNNISTPIEIDDFLGTLLNVYVFLFILAGVLAIAVANSITNPIKKLGQKLSQFNLGKKNEPLRWDDKGEIGTLISEYNQLILKLEESANLIAKTERDTAWREMAKQVAHEIKNPLTSMKLSIQHLERAYSLDPVKAKELIDRASNTLIEQIDNLSQIAGEFSSFGKLPQGQNEKVILNEVVSTIHDLFRKRDDMDITLAVPIDEIFVFADKNHLIRILNNIVKNAIQAIPSERRGKISLNLYKDDQNAYIKVSDNGVGIPEHMYEKVFTPNFTTKSSGTGLGLAISANMIESFNGRLYFETQESIGTDFYINIPLMHLEDNYRDENKVDLD